MTEMIIAPRDADEAFARASDLWQRGDAVRSEALLRELVARCPSHEGATMLLATILRNEGRLDAASRATFELCSQRGFEGPLVLSGARFIQECQRQSLADELCDAAIAQGNVSSELWAVAGNIARELGDFPKARARYFAALDASVDLNKSFVLGALAHTLRYADPGHPDIARFLSHFRNDAASTRARASTGFGLAKIYDDLGDRERASNVLRESNVLVRSGLGWEPREWAEFVQSRKIERVARVRHADAPGFVPVFILGLPRTGTTLTASRLAMHTGARDRGELRVLRFIAGKLIGGGHLGKPDAVEEAAHLYRAHARQDDAPATYYIDQDPLNFRYLHLIEAMFPQARIILCQRDRRDTALSLWSQDFAHQDCAFSYSFSDIASFAAGYDELTEFWQQTLSLPIHVLNYERLVTDPQSVLGDLREFMGMPETETVPSQIAAPVNTASVWQARQPIYTTSVGRWRDYLPWVPELAGFDAGC